MGSALGLFLTYILPALITAGAGIAGSVYNTSKQEDVNQQNLAYSQGMTEKQWERDDTSLQRQVEDAKMAGLSPLAVTGALNSSSPLNYAAQAPQMDLASLVGAFSSFENVANGYEKFKDRKQQSESQEKELSSDLYKFNAQLKASKELQDSQLASQVEQLNKTLAYQYDVLNEQSKAHAQDLESERLVNLSEQSMKLYSEVASTLGMSPQIHYVTDITEYVNEYNQFMFKYQNYLKDEQGISAKYTSTGSSNSGQGGLSIAGTGLNVGSSTSTTYDWTEARLHEMYKVYMNGAILPIFIDKDKYQSREYIYKSDN